MCYATTRALAKCMHLCLVAPMSGCLLNLHTCFLCLQEGPLGRGGSVGEEEEAALALNQLMVRGGVCVGGWERGGSPGTRPAHKA